MKIKICLYTLAALALSVSFIRAEAQTAPWKEKKCAVVLTYDDGYDQQLTNAVPVLDSLGLKATFYLSAYSSSVRSGVNEWKKVAGNGHELGNHTLFHPCVANIPGRSWVPKDYQLDHYSVKRMTDETRMMNVFLEALDGKTERTFAFTCGDMAINDTFFIDSMKKDFVAARAVRNEMHSIDKVNLYNVDCFLVNNTSAEEMIGWAKKAMQNNSLLVILFHGVGGGNRLDVSVQAHRQFLQYLKKNEQDIWVAPMIDVAKYINKTRQTN